MVVVCCGFIRDSFWLWLLFVVVDILFYCVIYIILLC